MRPSREMAEAAAAEAGEVDAGALMERVRERVRSAPLSDAGPAVPPGLADPEPDLATLHAAADVLRPELRSHRRLLGRFVLAAKRLLLRLLAPSLELQARHNAAAARLLTHYSLRLERLEEQMEGLLATLEEREGRGPP